MWGTFVADRLAAAPWRRSQRSRPPPAVGRTAEQQARGPRAARGDRSVREPCYAEIAPRVKAICERYELPYNTGPFLRQLGGVQRTILRLALPGGTPRPKPGPFRATGDRDCDAVQAAMPTSARTSSSATAA